MLRVIKKRKRYDLEINGIIISGSSELDFSNLSEYGKKFVKGNILSSRYFFFMSNRIPLEMRFKLTYNNKISKYNEVEYYFSNVLNLPEIIVVLESPHKNEYDIPFKPIGNARGLTGRNIMDKLGEVMINITGFPHGDYAVSIVNAVPYQCSLGSLYKTRLMSRTRDAIWTELFLNQSSNTYLINIINQRKPLIVLNCSTGGPRHKRGTIHKSKINSMVYNELKGNISCPIWNCYHPTMWKIKNPRYRKVY